MHAQEMSKDVQNSIYSVLKTFPVRVQHRYRNIPSVQAAGCVGSGTVWEIPTHGYTAPVTTVSWFHTGVSSNYHIDTKVRKKLLNSLLIHVFTVGELRVDA